MGLFDKCKSMVAGARSWAASKYDSTKSAFKNVGKSFKEGCAKIWNDPTGKKTADKAKRIYLDAEERFNKAKFEYEESIKRYGKEIEAKVSRINACKKEIYDVQFNRFISVSSRLHNVTVRGVPFEELFDDSVLEVKELDGLRNKKEVVLIDFDNLSFSQVASMILTLGFSSRKKADESLFKAQEESKRVDEEITKMKSQQTKNKIIVESIDNVVDYFDKLIGNYSLLLDRFEFGIQSQRVKQMSHGDNVFNLKLDFRLMPIVHIQEFQSLFNLSIVLKQMASLGYLSSEGELADKDLDVSQNLYITAVNAKLCA